MQNIDSYINEKLVISKDIDTQYKYYPKTKEELREIIEKRISKEGNECNLNDIDVSAITDMSDMFYKLRDFNGNISEWNVSNVETMHNMFFDCYKFNQNISEWDVSKVTDMHNMFMFCYKFNQDISKWDVHNVENMYGMFMYCKNFNQDLSKWDVSNVNDIRWVFRGCSKFDGNKLEKWNIQNIKYNNKGAFEECNSAPSWWK